MDGTTTPQSNSSGPSGSKLSKIALIFLGVIFLAVVAEGGYYFYTKRVGAPSIFPTPKPTPETERATSSVGAGDKIIRYEKAAAYTEKLVGLTSSSSFILSSNITTVTYGQVIESVFEEKVIAGTKYVYRVELTDNNGKYLNNSYREDEVASAEVVLRGASDELTPIELKDIKPGDNVLIREELNLLADFSGDTIYFEVSR